MGRDFGDRPGIFCLVVESPRIRFPYQRGLVRWKPRTANAIRLSGIRIKRDLAIAKKLNVSNSSLNDFLSDIEITYTSFIYLRKCTPNPSS
jgi:hypothetical protein